MTNTREAQLVVVYGDIHAGPKGKFIQVLGPEGEYLALAPLSLCTFHANIAQRFFHDQGIMGRYNYKRDSFHVQHPLWRIVGGGHFSFDSAACEMRMSGVSLAYGPFDREMLERQIKHAEMFSQVRVIIDF